MEKYGPDPTFENDYMQDIYLLDEVKSRKNYVKIAKHSFNNIDSYWPYASSLSGVFYQV